VTRRLVTALQLHTDPLVIRTTICAWSSRTNLPRWPNTSDRGAAFLSMQASEVRAVLGCWASWGELMTNVTRRFGRWFAWFFPDYRTLRVWSLHWCWSSRLPRSVSSPTDR